MKVNLTMLWVSQNCRFTVCQLVHVNLIDNLEICTTEANNC